jgi:hypothetical protein
MVTIKKNKSLLWFLLLLLLFAVIFGFLYKEKYLNCLTKNIYMCISSKKYTSVNNKFSFRYLKDYPLTFASEDNLNKSGWNGKFAEWVNFSNEFYPNAGGDRLGSIIVEKNASYQSINQFGDEILNNFNKKPERLKGTPPKTEYLKIGGENAVRIVTSQQPSSFSQPSDDYVMVRNRELYRIGFDYNDYYHKLPIEYYQKGKELILSTFTFY